MAGELMNILNIASKGLRGFAEPYLAMKMDKYKRMRDLQDRMELAKIQRSPEGWKPRSMEEALTFEREKWGMKPTTKTRLQLLNEELYDIQKAKGNISALFGDTDERVTNYYNLREKQILDEIEKEIGGKIEGELPPAPAPISPRPNIPITPLISETMRTIQPFGSIMRMRDILTRPRLTKTRPTLDDMVTIEDAKGERRTMKRSEAVRRGYLK
ncbi:MAG: hypothetical protein FJ150_02680 [Euryarchaeota archaeon]|nr:hypothetical protein [Euryarchaeota archaeon]